VSLIMPGISHWLSNARSSLIYDRVTNDLGCIWFSLLAALTVWTAVISLTATTASLYEPAEWVNLAARASTAMLYSSFAWFIFRRPPPVARLKGLLPPLAALAGTYLPWSFVLLAVNHDPQGRTILPGAIMLTGSVAAVVSVLYLGKSFSLVPQAQRLVRTGPYSVVRHPLYLAEEITLIGCLLKFFSVAALTIFVMHLALQISRVLFEENLLIRCCPGYSDYARLTQRVIPFVW
jgi:protein-S-isoprenylcysteine O-methyltransferase Ste14